MIAPLALQFALQLAQPRIAFVKHVLAVAQHRLENLATRLGALHGVAVSGETALQIDHIVLAARQCGAAPGQL